MNRCHHCHVLSVILIILFCSEISKGANYVLHPDIEERVVAITKLIKKSPENTELLFKRGQLHLQHEEYDDALADFEYVLLLNPTLEQVQLAKASTLLHGGWIKSAKVILDVFIKTHQTNTSALTLRGKVHAALNDHLSAANDLSRAIELLHNPTPDHYIELASEFAQVGEAYTEHALQSIDKGIKRFGPLVTLQLFAIDLEQTLHRFNEALKRLDTIANQSQRKEQFLLKRGLILETAHRLDEAQTAYEAVLIAIKTLPARHQNTKLTKAFKDKAIQALSKLRDKSSKDSNQE